MSIIIISHEMGGKANPVPKIKISIVSQKKKFLPRSLEISSNNNSTEPLKREKGQENTSSILLIRVLLRNISLNGSNDSTEV